MAWIDTHVSFAGRHAWKVFAALSVIVILFDVRRSRFHIVATWDSNPAEHQALSRARGVLLAGIVAGRLSSVGRLNPGSQ